LVNKPRQTAQGLILDSRVERVGTIATSHGGYILYRIETRVQYSIGGDKHDRWIPASEPTSDRASLQMQLLKQPRTCLISWEIHHEENAHCELP
jgi:hypothetical protein